MEGRYGRVLAAPHVRSLVGASVLARIPLGIAAIALVLFVQHATGSYATAGAVAAAYAGSAAVLAIGMARLIDRRGQTTVLLVALVVSSAGMIALLVFGLSGAPGPVLALCAVAIGALPPVTGCLRPLWPELLGTDVELTTAAYALDAILIEVAFVIGPLLTGILVALFSPQVPLIVGLVLVNAGTLWFASTTPSRRWRADPGRSPHLLGALASPGLRTLLLGAVGMGCCFGTLEIGLAGYGNDQGIAGLAGMLIALQAIGSSIAGLWYGANAERIGSIDRGLLLLLGALPLSVAVLAVAPGLWAVVPLALLSGCVIAPLSAAQNLLAGALAPRGAVTEAFTWITTSLVVGIAAGNAVGGALVDATSWRVAVLAGAATATVAAVATFARRRTLVVVASAGADAADPNGAALNAAVAPTRLAD
jgi:MFS family permease